MFKCKTEVIFAIPVDNSLRGTIGFPPLGKLNSVGKFSSCLVPPSGCWKELIEWAVPAVVVPLPDDSANNRDIDNLDISNLDIFQRKSISHTLGYIGY